MKALSWWRMTFLLFLTIGISDPSLAGEPLEKIKQTTDKILAIVTDPALKAPDTEAERKRLIRKAVDERFDWEEMSRRTLARYWSGRTAQEKKEFVDLFGKLLERTYMDKIEGYSGEKVIYEGDKVDDGYGLVNVKIATQKGTEIPLTYRLWKKGDDWLVYDISIEGVSLINNYRTQFSSILLNSPFKSLLDQIRTKIEQGK
jgi:phospholipid transport system substrate-binding protein